MEALNSGSSFIVPTVPNYSSPIKSNNVENRNNKSDNKNDTNKNANINNNNGTTDRSEKDSKEAVVYKTDSMIIYPMETMMKLDSSYTIAINETDFLNLMMKRKVKHCPYSIKEKTLLIFQKIDPIWTSIHYL